jgi:putative aldouronate transport system permease protein
MQPTALSKRRFGSVFKSEWPLYLFLAPAVLVTILFAYLPMFSNIIAFMQYDIFAGWLGLGSKFVGFKNFVTIFKDHENFYPLVWRTFYYSVVRLVTGQPTPFILALLINELRHRKFKRTVQTIFYLPHFVSWVTIASLTYWFLTSDTEGLINNIRGLFGATNRIITRFGVDEKKEVAVGWDVNNDEVARVPFTEFTYLRKHFDEKFGAYRQNLA